MNQLFTMPNIKIDHIPSGVFKFIQIVSADLVDYEVVCEYNPPNIFNLFNKNRKNARYKIQIVHSWSCFKPRNTLMRSKHKVHGIYEYDFKWTDALGYIPIYWDNPEEPIEILRQAKLNPDRSENIRHGKVVFSASADL